MKRSILVSLLVIGAAAAFMVGGATFAPFTSTDSDLGDVSAGTVVIDVYGTGTLDFTYAGGDPGCDANLAPGDGCVALVTVENTGSLQVSLGAPVSSETGDLETCGDLDSLSTAASGYSGDGILDPGDTETFTVTVTLEGTADNSCQGDTGTVTVAVTATNT